MNTATATKLTRQQRKENSERAQRGRNVLDAYAVEIGEVGPGVDWHTVVTDMLADVMHACTEDCEKCDFEDALRVARDHHRAEQAGL